jgi:phosphopantetheinyl transferase
MNILLNITTNTAAIAIADSDGINFDGLCYAEQVELAALRHPRRQQERMAALFLLHDVLKIKHGLYHKPNGQPALQHCQQQISIAHSKDGMAAAAAAQGKCHGIGVDVEAKKRNFAGIKDGYLSKKEQQFIGADELCGIAWCAKEAAYKAAGIDGLSMRCNIELQPFTAQNDSIMAAISHPMLQTLAQIKIISLPLHWVALTIINNI